MHVHLKVHVPHINQTVLQRQAVLTPQSYRASKLQLGEVDLKCTTAEAARCEAETYTYISGCGQETLLSGFKRDIGNVLLCG